MGFFPWLSQYELGIPPVDHQHKELLTLANRIYDAVWSGADRSAVSKEIEAIVQLTRGHFAFEERLLADCGYPGLTEHKAAHHRLIEDILRLQERFRTGAILQAADLAGFLNEWLLDHVNGPDREYSRFLGSQGP